MIGCLLGGIAVVGLFKLARMRHHGGYGACGGHGFGGWHHHRHHHGPWGGGFGGRGFGGDPSDWGDPLGRRGGFGQRFVLRRLFERLDTTPGQEKVIASALDELRDAARGLRGEADKSRADIAAALRKPAFDEVLLGELYARHDTALESLRKAFVGAMAHIHDALDERQRQRLADIVESGGLFDHRGRGW